MAHRPFGLPGSFDLAGTVQVRGDLAATVPLPFGFEPGTNSGHRYTVFSGATVQGHAAGVVAVEGPFEVTAGDLPSLKLAGADAGPSIVLDPVAETDFWSWHVPGWEGLASPGSAEKVAVMAKGLQISGFQRAILIGNEGNATAMPASFALDATGWTWSPGSLLRITRENFTLSASSFLVGGTLKGTAQAGGDAVVDPRLVSGTDATITLAANHAQATGFRLTQVIDKDRKALIAARLEVDPVAGSGAVNLREASYLGDAVVTSVRLEGPTFATLRVDGQRPLVAAALGDVQRGVGTRSPGWLDFSAGLDPWLAAGGVTAFEVGAPVPHDAFDATLHLEGLNFEAVDITFHVPSAVAARPAVPATPGSAGLEPSSPSWPWLAVDIGAVVLAVAAGVTFLAVRRGKSTPPLARPPSPASPQARPGPHPTRIVGPRR